MNEATMTGAELSAPQQPKHAAPQVASRPANHDEGGTPHLLYRASGGRRLAFSFIFLLLLPFYVSLGPMLWARVTQGHWTGTPGLMILALGFTIIMFLILVELMSSIRTRVELGSKAVRMTLPTGRGAQPLFSYATHEIPYSDIAAVEMRREIYGGSIAPMMLKGARIVRRNGDKVQLGYVNEANVDPAFPFPEIAQRIAARAGVEITDTGNVRRLATKKLFGIPTAPRENRTIDEQQMRDLNRNHTRLMIVLFSGLAVLVVLGILGDMMQPG